MPKLYSARRHVPQVRPLPAKVSLKKILSPLAMSAAYGSVDEGVLTWHAPSAEITTATLMNNSNILVWSMDRIPLQLPSPPS